ncbi:hypothetical protein IWQ60_006449 [Tieghemiomyces parasiticus]|uniref:Uncharacterized protein n=1 Tax=Tieghemiomyces parasiticus TaxID=78921 RepID=A0A9W8AAE8_9FUNG|nr:hypothetical protein IWQ60_006449 [Tieghemiomyces parasiticus]
MPMVFDSVLMKWISTGPDDEEEDVFADINDLEDDNDDEALRMGGTGAGDGDFGDDCLDLDDFDTKAKVLLTPPMATNIGVQTFPCLPSPSDTPPGSAERPPSASHDGGAFVLHAPRPLPAFPAAATAFHAAPRPYHPPATAAIGSLGLGSRLPPSGRDTTAPLPVNSSAGSALGRFTAKLPTFLRSHRSSPNIKKRVLSRGKTDPTLESLRDPPAPMPFRTPTSPLPWLIPGGSGGPSPVIMASSPSSPSLSPRIPSWHLSSSPVPAGTTTAAAGPPLAHRSPAGHTRLGLTNTANSGGGGGLDITGASPKAPRRVMSLGLRRSGSSLSIGNPAAFRLSADQLAQFRSAEGAHRQLLTSWLPDRRARSGSILQRDYLPSRAPRKEIPRHYTEFWATSRDLVTGQH